MSSESDSQTGEQPSARFLPYPASTLSPTILPNDLSTFKSRGISRVERQLQQEMKELHDRYREMVDRFNWNKLIYEAKFGFEPIVGETYHLYDLQGGYTLSMIAPEQWRGKKWIGSFRLGAEGSWHLLESANDFDLQELVDDEDEAPTS